jgi:hypothetical protein
VKTTRDERVFLVRMWRGDDAEWRGSVLEVATGRRFYLGAPGEVGDFITISLRNAEQTPRDARGDQTP